MGAMGIGFGLGDGMGVGLVMVGLDLLAGSGNWERPLRVGLMVGERPWMAG